jgi:hypothetical protein
VRRAALLSVILLVGLVGGALSAGATATGPPGPAVSGLSVTPGPFSAVVGWSLDTAGSVVVEYGVDDRYGVWADQIRRERPGAGSVTLTGLEPATRYRFRLTARSEPIVGSTVVTGTFATAGYPRSASAAIAGPSGPAAPPPSPPSKSGEEQITGATASAASSSGGARLAQLTIDGAPFFPRVVWAQCQGAWDDAISAGVNVFLGAGCKLPDAKLSAVAGRAFSTLEVGMAGADGPGVIGWHQPDEPDWHARDGSALTRVSTPGRVTFLTVTDKFSNRKAPPNGGRGIYPGLFASSDVIGFDSYPLEERCKPDTLSQVFDLQRDLVAQVPGKPTFQWIESGPMEKCFRYDPTPSIVRAETWLAIAGGAVGIGYFPGLWEAPIRDEARRINRDIVALAPALLGSVGTASVDPASGLRVGVRRHGGATYVIAVNPEFSSRTARITVQGLNGRELRVFGEDRVVRATANVISDDFPPLATRVYILPPTR